MKTRLKKRILIFFILLTTIFITATLLIQYDIKIQFTEPEVKISIIHKKPDIEPEPVFRPEPKPEIKPEAKPVPKKKPEPVSKPKPEPEKRPVFEPEPIIKPKPEQKPKPKIKIVKKPAPEPEIKASFSITPDEEKYIPSAGPGSFTITVKSNTRWRVNSDKEWLKLYPLKGNKKVKSVKASYGSNTGNAKRTAVITFIPAGTGIKTILVTQEGPTPTVPEVSTGKAVSINENTIVVSGSIDDFGVTYDSVLQHGHCWSETELEPTTDDNITELGPSSQPGSFVSKLANLEPLKKYYTRAYAINETGTAYGTTVELSTPISDGLIAYYPFDKDAKEMSGYGIHGTVHGDVKLTTDRYDNVNYAYRFNGENSYISIGDYFDNTSTLTFSFWVYLSTTGTVPFVARYDTTKDLYAYYIDCSGNRIGIGVRDNFKTLLARTSRAAIPRNEWTHITGIFDLTQSEIKDRFKIYCNGTLEDLTYSSSSDIKTIPDISVPFDIGRYTTSSRTKLYMNGILDEICIYSRVLSEDEIKSIFSRESGTPLLTPGIAIVSSGKLSGLTNKIAQITGNLASFGRNYAEVLEHGHCWSETNLMPTVTQSAKTKLGKTDRQGNFLSQIQGLNPHTSYYIRAYATNATGTSYGELVRITTRYNPYITVTTPADWSINTNPDIEWITHFGRDKRFELYPANYFKETSAACISGNFAYITENDTSGLRIIDLSFPSKPSLSSFLEISGTALNLDLHGNFVYLLSIDYTGTDADREENDSNYYKLIKIDVSKPESPLVTETCIITNISAIKPTDLFVAGSLVYVTVSPDLYIVDTTKTPSHPYPSHRCSPDGALGVYVKGDYAYIADGTGGFRIINITDRDNPETSAIYSTPGPARDVFITESHAYIAAGEKGLQIIDISDPVHPQLSVGFETSSTAESVFVSQNYAYVAAGEKGLQIIDISDPLNPKLAGEYNTPGNADEVLMSGRYAYIADGVGGLQVIHLGPFYEGAQSYYNYEVPLFALPEK